MLGGRVLRVLAWLSLRIRAVMVKRLVERRALMIAVPILPVAWLGEGSC